MGYDVGAVTCKSNCFLDVTGCKTVLLDKSPIAISKAIDMQSYPAVASNGTGYLVVWQDRRNGSHYDIAGTRVTTAGKTLDGHGKPITSATGNQEHPAVASDGLGYLVVWQSGGNIQGVRIDKTGIVLDSAAISISTASGSQERPSVAFNGTDYQVVWQDKRNVTSFDIYGARVDKTGKVKDPNGAFISLANKDQENPVVACNTTNCLATWDDTRKSTHPDIFGARVNKNGSVLDINGIAICTVAANDDTSPAVVSDGTDYLVVWKGHVYIQGSRVNSSGKVLDPWGLSIGNPVSSTSNYDPSVSWDGTGYLVAWTWGSKGSGIIQGMMLNKVGKKKYASNVRFDPNTSADGYVSMASAGGKYLVVWENSHGSPNPNIFGTRVSP